MTPNNKTFQSTLPARGVTAEQGLKQYEVIFQSTLPARGVTVDGEIAQAARSISIHTPREGSDLGGN